MRLTLRTLLSWKDGMLDEQTACELASRIEASDAARRLVERIDEVVARPTLSAAAPDASGFAAAANTAAEYLDNVLPADRLGEFEQVCFASDAQLAETAASHEILAAWSREPVVALDAAARRRLLAAVRARAESEREANADAARPAAAPGPRQALRAASRPARAPVSAWLLVAAALVLLVVLGGVLGWSLSKRGAKPGGVRDVATRPDEVREPAPTVKPAAEPAAEPAAAPPVEDVPVPPAAAVAPAPDVPPGAEPTVEPVPSAPVPSAPVPAPAEPGGSHVVAADAGDFPPFGDDEPMESVTAGSVASDHPSAAAEPPAAVAPLGGAGDRRVPQGDALAIAAPAAVPQGPPPAPAGPLLPAAVPRDARVAVVGPAVLLHRPVGSDAEAWQAAVDGTPLDLPVDLVAPPFGRPTLVVDDTRITLEPGTLAALGRDADGAPRLEVVFGAAVAAGGDRLGVTAGGLAGKIAAGLAAPVGVEARIARAPGGAAESSDRTARVLPMAGRLDWRPTAVDGGPPAEAAAGGGAATAIPAGQALVWRSGRPKVALLEAADPLPDWLTGRRIDDPVDALAARALAARLAAGTPALPALRELATDRRSERRMAAAAALALVGEFDTVARLVCAAGVDGLREAEWARLDAAAVQPALARGPKAAEALAETLAAQAPPGAAAAVVRFARGFSDEELAAGGAAELVAALESPHLVVRRYAIANLVEITRPTAVERLKYRADRPAEGLRDGAAWWRAQLERDRIRRGPAAGGAAR